METSIENILSELIIRTADRFKLDRDDALAVVAQSRVADVLSECGHTGSRTIEEFCAELFDEIAKGG